MKVASLCRIASGAEIEADAEPQNVDDPVDVGRPDGPWLLVIRDEATAVIAGIPYEQISAVAASWAATEEWRAAGAEPGGLESLVGELRDLARAAKPSRAALPADVVVMVPRGVAVTASALQRQIRMLSPDSRGAGR